MAKTALGVIVGTRDVFPISLIPEARKSISAAIAAVGARAVMLGATDTPAGAVAGLRDAKVCAELFKKHAGEIVGIIVVLPNFGDERGIAETIRLSGLNVPVLVQAYPDAVDASAPGKRRDAFCGKISVCNNFVQQGTKFTLTTHHTVRPDDKSFEADLQDFVAVCRVVRGLRGARIGAIGARPADFRTVRYSEKILQAHGITTEVVDLSDIFGRAGKLGDRDARVVRRAKAINSYCDTSDVAREKILLMAKLGLVIDDWTKENDLDATAIQCWRSLQENYGVASCALMSMMSEALKPSACEVDVTGAVSMLALTLATGAPAGLADWNNNYQDDPDKCVFFHCSNWPKSLCTAVRMGSLDFMGKAAGREDQGAGAVVGRAVEGPLTFVRVSTEDSTGRMVGYVGEGEFTTDPLETFGACGVVDVQGLPKLLRLICTNGYEHHVAFGRSFVADVLHEALGNYLGWSIYRHS
jgi:L-fucose isomerase-like protein